MSEFSNGPWTVTLTNVELYRHIEALRETVARLEGRVEEMEQRYGTLDDRVSDIETPGCND